jgi:hypothetical protein
MNEDTLYWVFSTIAQTYGAIVGIIGMLTIYRLQNLSNRIEDCRKRIEKNAFTTFGAEARILSPENLATKWDKHTGKEYLKEHRSELFHMIDTDVQRIKIYMPWSNKIRENFLIFFVFHLVIIIIPSIFCLFFVSVLVSFKWVIISLILTALVISAISIISVGIGLTEKFNLQN